jgi:glycosyl transferase family 25
MGITGVTLVVQAVKMKIFVISLTNSVARRTSIQQQFGKQALPFEFIDAVDGRSFTEEDLKQYTDFERVMAHRQWLSNGAIGCALSHLKVYRKILDEGLDYALVMEDDVLLKPEFSTWIRKFRPLPGQSDISLLYFVSWAPCLLIRESMQEFYPGIRLYQPKDAGQPITAAAYIIKAEACRTMLQKLHPVAWAADSWGDFVKIGAVQSISCAFPMPVSVIDAKSTINYIESGKTTKIFNWIEHNKVFPLHLLLKMRRKWMRNKMLNVVLE